MPDLKNIFGCHTGYPRELFTDVSQIQEFTCARRECGGSSTSDRNIVNEAFKLECGHRCCRECRDIIMKRPRNLQHCDECDKEKRSYSSFASDSLDNFLSHRELEQNVPSRREDINRDADGCSFSTQADPEADRFIQNLEVFCPYGCDRGMRIRDMKRHCRQAHKDLTADRTGKLQMFVGYGLRNQRVTAMQMVMANLVPIKDGDIWYFLCPDCRFIIGDFPPDSDVNPYVYHKLKRPNCPAMISYARAEPSEGRGDLFSAPVQKSNQTYETINQEMKNKTFKNVRQEVMSCQVGNSQNMARESSRIMTFPAETITARRLASFGCYMSQGMDKIRCAFCGFQEEFYESMLTSLQACKDIVKRHLMEMGCPFLKGINRRNIPCVSEPQSWRSPVEFIKSPDDRELGDELGVSSERPDMSNMAVKDKRIESLRPHVQDTAKVNGLADAGFYITPEMNQPACFWCGIGLPDVNKIMVAAIWSCHAILSPHCSFVLREKGEEFVQNQRRDYDNLPYVVTKAITGILADTEVNWETPALYGQTNNTELLNGMKRPC